MNREEFKEALSNLVDNLVPVEGELSDAAEAALQDNFGDVATEILNEEEPEVEEEGPQTADERDGNA